MKRLRRELLILYWCVTAATLILAVTLATYAWFTTNRTVKTNTATSKTNTEYVTLEISEQGGDAFSAVEEASIVQVNQTNPEELLPVSTADLQNFVYNPMTINNKDTLIDEANNFELVENEDKYYHGRIYLRAAAEGMETGSRLALYLDDAEEAGGAIVSTTSGSLQSVCRLGLKFNSESGNSIILRAEEAENSSESAGNTVLDGQTLGDGEVLSWNGSGVSRAADSSSVISQYTIQENDTSITLPQAPLTYLEYNQIYQLDIYFYIEGCDPDCTSNISGNVGDLHLAFYGVVS